MVHIAHSIVKTAKSPIEKRNWPRRSVHESGTGKRVTDTRDPQPFDG